MSSIVDPGLVQLRFGRLQPSTWSIVPEFQVFLTLFLAGLEIGHRSSNDWNKTGCQQTKQSLGGTRSISNPPMYVNRSRSMESTVPQYWPRVESIPAKMRLIKWSFIVLVTFFNFGRSWAIPSDISSTTCRFSPDWTWAADRAKMIWIISDSVWSGVISCSNVEHATDFWISLPCNRRSIRSKGQRSGSSVYFLSSSSDFSAVRLLWGVVNRTYAPYTKNLPWLRSWLRPATHPLIDPFFG